MNHTQLVVNDFENLRLKSKINFKNKILLTSLLLAAFAVALYKFQDKFKCKSEEKSLKPSYIVYDKRGPKSQILFNVETVLNRLGLEKIEVQTKGLTPENVTMDWDLLWTFHHHDHHKMNWSKLEYYQKLNHWPGNYAMVSKSVLSTKTTSNYVPKGFLTAEKVREISKFFPDKKFVMKLKSNRGVKLVDPQDMNFTKTTSIDEYFAQEFIHPPLLWNGHKFDFSIFVVITSVSPLRVYSYDKNVNLRFCKKPYNISNVDDVDSYVIGSDFWPSQDFERVKKFNEKSYTNKEAFEDFMMSKGGNLEEIWRKVDDLIRSIVMEKERFIIEGLSRFGTSKYNHFELFRFDMLFDEDFNLFLLEINMSPNLVAPPKKNLNKFMFENLLYNLFKLIGIGTSYAKNNFKFSDGDVELMVAHPHGMSVNPQLCVDCDKCDDECSICWHCMDNNERYDLILAYNEQMNIGDFKRIFPPEKDFMENADEDFYEGLSDENKKHVAWYEEMCKKNKRFC